MSGAAAKAAASRPSSSAAGGGLEYMSAPGTAMAPANGRQLVSGATGIAAPERIPIGDTLASIALSSHFVPNRFDSDRPSSSAETASALAFAAAAGPSPSSARGATRPTSKWLQRQQAASRQRQAQAAPASTPRWGDHRGYSNFQDLLNTEWSHPHELRPAAPTSSPPPEHSTRLAPDGLSALSEEDSFDSEGGPLDESSLAQQLDSSDPRGRPPVSLPGIRSVRSSFNSTSGVAAAEAAASAAASGGGDGGGSGGGRGSLFNSNRSLKAPPLTSRNVVVSSRPASSCAPSSIGAAGLDADEQEKVMEAELKLMLKDLGVDVTALTVSVELESMLNLAQSTSGLDPRLFNPEAATRRRKRKEALGAASARRPPSAGGASVLSGQPPPTPNGAATARGGAGGPSPLETVELDVGLDLDPSFRVIGGLETMWERRRRNLGMVSRLAPGVYASLDERDTVRPTSVRGLPSRGVDAQMDQAKSVSTEVRWRKNDTRAWANAVSNATYRDHYISPWRDFPAEKAPRTSNGGAPPAPPSPKDARGKKSRWGEFVPESHDAQLEKEKRETMEWKMKVAECARNLAIEAHRFRFAD